MRLSDMRRPRPAATGNTAKRQIQHIQYTAILREFVGCVVLGAFIGVIVGSAILGMLDNQRLASTKMKRAASMAGVDHGR